MALPNTADPCHNVAGPVRVYVNTGSGGTLELLGLTLNGVQIEEQDFTSGVPSDEFGGQEGPPSDYQLFGVLHRIDLELGRYDEAVLLKLGQRANPAVSGNPFPGMLLKCSGKTVRVALSGANFYRNYPAAYVLGPIRRAPLGSQFTRAQISLTATAKVGDTIWDEADKPV